MWWQPIVRAFAQIVPHSCKSAAASSVVPGAAIISAARISIEAYAICSCARPLFSLLLCARGSSLNFAILPIGWSFSFESRRTLGTVYNGWATPTPYFIFEDTPCREKPVQYGKAG